VSGPGPTSATAAPAPAKPEASSLRLLATLAGAGALAGLLLVFVYQATAGPIAAYKQKVLEEAVTEVLAGPAGWEKLYLLDGALVREVPPGTDAKKLETVYRGYEADGTTRGVAIAAGEPGFQDVVRLIFGYDPAKKALLGMKVLESKETPGLGDKIEKDSKFVGQFAGTEAPLLGYKGGEGAGDPRGIDMITGATISSRAVIRIINNAIARWAPLIEAFEAGDAEGGS
jgi:electron transport complex protein RnfG